MSFKQNKWHLFTLACIKICLRLRYLEKLGQTSPVTPVDESSLGNEKLVVSAAVVNSKIASYMIRCDFEIVGAECVVIYFFSCGIWNSSTP